MAAIRTRWDNSAFFSGSDDPDIATTAESMRADISALKLEEELEPVHLRLW